MKKLLELVFTYEQVTYGYISINVKFGYKNDEVTRKVNEVHWSEHPPVEVSDDPETKRALNVGRDEFCEWINFVLTYKQSSGIFMGTSPAPDLSNDFAFINEFKLFKVMIAEFEHAKNNGDEPVSVYIHRTVCKQYEKVY